ncbi:phage holin family protein [Gephyromycinifex aptenodytis]|uniref:phage holin family protein n=1 Tax=Gephyromycinifex aptenodytis TaxID=2716227 RepID=UPI001446DE32|nr:phage holin family protein [Gephyromycinifex aptenodytis]
MSTAIPPRQDPAAPRNADPTLGRLVADATENLSGIIRNEIALAKAEVSVDAKKAGKGVAMFAGAGFFALFGFGFLLHTIALGLITAGLADWLAYLIVTVALFIIAGILAMIGKSAISKIKGKPQRTIDSTKESIAAVKASTSGTTTAQARAMDPVTHGATDGTIPTATQQKLPDPASSPALSGGTGSASTGAMSSGAGSTATKA